MSMSKLLTAGAVDIPELSIVGNCNTHNLLISVPLNIYSLIFLICNIHPSLDMHLLSFAIASTIVS